MFMREGAMVINILPLGYFPPAEARVCRSVGVDQIMLPVSGSLDSPNRYSDIQIDLNLLVECVSANCPA